MVATIQKTNGHHHPKVVMQKAKEIPAVTTPQFKLPTPAVNLSSIPSNELSDVHCLYRYALGNIEAKLELLSAQLEAAKLIAKSKKEDLASYGKSATQDMRESYREAEYSVAQFKLDLANVKSEFKRLKQVTMAYSMELRRRENHSYQNGVVNDSTLKSFAELEEIE